MKADNGLLLGRGESTLKLKSISEKKSEWVDCTTFIILTIVVVSLGCVAVRFLV